MSRQQIRIHLICWVIYIAYEILVSGTISGKYSHPVAYLLFYLVEVSLFYIHALLLMPWLFGPTPKNLWALPASILVEIGVYVLIAAGISWVLDRFEIRRAPFELDHVFIIASLWRVTMFVMFASGYFFLMRNARNTRERMQQNLELEQLRSRVLLLERDFIRAQTAPHLLFNTLNFVKYAAKHKPAQSDEAIIRLSEILDFSISNSPGGLIPIAKELRQVENIIRLNQLRFDEKLQLDYQVKLDHDNILVLPLVLLTLVENVFKHGDLRDSGRPAVVHISAQDGYLSIKTRNLTGNRSITNLSGNSGSGLINIRMRLTEKYLEDYSFTHEKRTPYFETALRMPYYTTKRP